MKKYIFLDIDGVLCTNSEFWINTQEFWIENEQAKELRVIYPFNKKCVNSFNRILNEVDDIEIILTSDWRKNRTLEELDEIFKFNGVIKSPIDTTGHVSPYFGEWLEKLRMSDIETYLRKHNMINIEMTNHTNWIIIDDLDIRQWLPDEYKDRFFPTQDSEGISQEGMVERIIKKLKSYETEENSK